MRISDWSSDVCSSDLTGQGIQLSSEDLDLLVSSRAYGILTQAAADYQRDLCLQRSVRSRSTSVATMPSMPDPAERTSKSSGTTRNESASAGTDDPGQGRVALDRFYLKRSGHRLCPP